MLVQSQISWSSITEETVVHAWIVKLSQTGEDDQVDPEATATSRHEGLSGAQAKTSYLDAASMHCN